MFSNLTIKIKLVVLLAPSILGFAINGASGFMGTAASEEQSSGVGQVSHAISQLKSTTHQNASLAEDLSATAEELYAQAENLRGMMAQFKML